MPRAVRFDRYGDRDVLQVVEVPRPTAGDGEVLVRVHAAAVNPADWHVMRGLPYIARPVFGLARTKVRVRGTDVARHVAATGERRIARSQGDRRLQREERGDGLVNRRWPRHRLQCVRCPLGGSRLAAFSPRARADFRARRDLRSRFGAGNGGRRGPLLRCLPEVHQVLLKEPGSLGCDGQACYAAGIGE